MNASSPRSGRRLFVIRHVIIIEIGPTAAARFAGFDDGSLSYPGSATLHPKALLRRPLSRAKIHHTHFVKKFG
jgi:hypothetical protein